MPRLLALALVALTALFGASNGALAQERFALVIGNSQYQAVTPLPNPVRDAGAIAGFLRTAGFKVTAATDLDQAAMRRAVQDFTAMLADKGEDTVALVYFAGHGVQVDGVNYLLPVDAKVEREADVALQGVRFGDVMNMLNQVDAKTRIVILDACRNNPFADGNSARGLAIVNAPAGSLVAYSTSPGATAADGSGSNSPFTEALLAAAKAPGTPIEATLKNVRLAVHKVTNGQQVPWEVSSLVKPFSFFPGEAPVESEPAGEQSADAWRKELQSYSPEEAFDVIVREDRVVVYREYIALFPDSPFIARLRGLLDRRLEMWAWFEAVTLDQAAAYAAFLKRYPTSDLAVTAQRLRKQARLRAAVASASPGALGLAALGARALPPRIENRDVIKKIAVPVEKTVYRDVIKYQDVIKEIKVPVEKIVYRDRIREVNVPVDRIVYKDVIKYRDVIKYVPKIVYQDRIKIVPKIVYRDRIKIVPKVVYRDRIKVVTKIVYRDRIVRVPTGGHSSRPFQRHRRR